MARMFPDVPLLRSQSSAEQRLYQLFKTALPDEFVVYHSVSYVLSGARTRRPRCGEADFVVARRELGLLVVEVKGGGVRFDPARNRWESVGRQGVVGLHAATLVSPAVERRLRDAQLLADGGDRLAGGQLGVGLPKLVNDLLGTVTLAFHRESPLPAAAMPRPGNGLS